MVFAMQSKSADLIALCVLLAVALVCAVLVLIWHEGDAALLLALLAGATAGFVLPRGAWRWALILAAWIAIFALFKVRMLADGFTWCPPAVASPNVPAWTLVVLPFVAVYAGVALDWLVTQALHWLAFTNWHWVHAAKRALRIAALACAVLAVLASALMLAQPLRPYAVGQDYCWDEYCFVVLGVKRVKTLGSGAHRATAHGIFYVVTADMETPYWGRFDWSDDAVYAIDYDGTNYTNSPAGQRSVDALMHSRRSVCHTILGAGEIETVVFDLPENVVQPRLLVRDTLGFDGFLGSMRRNLYYVKPAFNLRYD